MPFSALEEYPQFIIYRATPSPSRPGKIDKLPCDWRTGNVADAHDSSIWTTGNNAREAADRFGVWPAVGVGFVFTDNDPFCFIDVDCDPGSPIARELRELFRDAGHEISISGAGLHLIGKWPRPLPHSCENREHHIALYHTRRFVALTGIAACGDAGADLSDRMPALVARYFAPGVEVAGGGWTDRPRPEWRGPADDDELIRRALAARPSPRAAFGQAATFAELWRADPVALGRIWPDTGRPYNASEADAALAASLAWWTGGDCERIERLMLRSGLAREKWERRDYLERTILGAVALCDGCYVERNAELAEIAGNAEQITLEDMLRRFAFVTTGSQVIEIDRPRRCFSLTDWKNALKASRTWIETGGINPATGELAGKWVPTTGLWEISPARIQSDVVTFRAGADVHTTDPDGKLAINIWRPTVRHPPGGGDPGLFLRHVDYLFGQDAGRFLDWLAHIEQCPGVLPHTGWVHISEQHGTGRNWLGDLLSLVWQGQVATNFDLSKMLTRGFNGRLSCKLLAVVDEINEGRRDENRQNEQTLRRIITEKCRLIDPKYGREAMEFNACRWLIFSNHISALPIPRGDRRFNVVMVAGAPRPPGYYRELYASLGDADFVAAVACHLRQRDLSGFDPGAHATMTAAKGEMIRAGMSELEELVDALVKRWPADVIWSATLREYLGAADGRRFGGSYKAALEAAGVKSWDGNVRVGARVGTVRVLRNWGRWRMASRGELAAELGKVEQGPGDFDVKQFVERILSDE